MLTPEQLEAAARKLCEIRGIDPDEVFGKRFRIDKSENPEVVSVLWWENLAVEIRAHLEIQEAIQSVPQPSPHVVLRAREDDLAILLGGIRVEEDF